MSRNCNISRSDHHGDILTLGGPKTNEIARDLLKSIQFPVGFGIHVRIEPTASGAKESDVIVWNNKEMLQSNNLEQKLVHGLIVRGRNPWGKDGTLTMFIGSGTYGTEASALAIVQSSELRSTVAESLQWSLVSVWNFVRSKVRSASPAIPQERLQLRRGYIALIEAHESIDPTGLSTISRIRVVEKKDVPWDLSSNN